MEIAPQARVVRATAFGSGRGIAQHPALNRVTSCNFGGAELTVINNIGVLGLSPAQHRISGWSSSAAKRVFDAGCVLLALPVMIPLGLAIAAAVWITSPGPVLFRQERVGQNGRVFTMLKFRTMVHGGGKAHHSITTLDNQSFTPLGPVLRRWKLDEIPQLANVLLGHMSLVGPRPKMPEHTIYELPCRPGLTGMATLAFADEEAMLSRVPDDRLDAFYYDAVLPAKHRMDSEYLANATFRSDLRLLARSLLRRWEDAAAQFDGDRQSLFSGLRRSSRVAMERQKVPSGVGWAAGSSFPIAEVED